MLCVVLEILDYSLVLNAVIRPKCGDASRVQVRSVTKINRKVILYALGWKPCGVD